MSDPHLPPETLDHIVDLLDDESGSLKECCLVAKSWVPRTRKHLFATIEFNSVRNLEIWKKTFPDPANSPACHAQTLWIGCPRAITMADVEEGGWIQAFSRVVALYVDTTTEDLDDSKISLTPLHRFSPVLRSLYVFSTLLLNSQIFDLVRSFPLLEDLTLSSHDTSTVNDDELDPLPTVVPLTPTALTGTLVLLLYRGIVNTARRLLGMPNGLRFRQLRLSWCDEEDLRWVERLVMACSDTLEYLSVACRLDDEPRSGPIDLSKATKLKNIVFRWTSLSIKWVTTTLETITPQHQDLQRISIHVPHPWVHDQVKDLDRLLVQLWDSHSIRTSVTCFIAEHQKREMRGWAGYMFPELTKRGIIDLVE